MVDPRIINYIKSNLSKGFSEKQIKNKLFQAGWSKTQVNNAFKQVSGKSPPRQKRPSPKKPSIPQTQKKPQPKRTSEKQNKSNKPLIYIIIGVSAIIVTIAILVIISGNNKISEEDIEKGTSTRIKQGKTKKFSLDEQNHEITVKSIQDNKVNLEVRSNVLEIEIEKGDSKKVDINNDSYYDLEIRVDNIENEEVEIFIQKINEQACTPEWECSDWSECVNETQTRNCSVKNNCKIQENKPKETRECNKTNETCEENWNCTEWGECVNETQTRNCTDENNCGTNKSKPAEKRNCTVLETCSELNGTLCNSSEICNGTELNSSDDNICCEEDCILNTVENEIVEDGSNCSEGYHLCNESEYCDINSGASMNLPTEDEICCSEECKNIGSFMDKQEMYCNSSRKEDFLIGFCSNKSVYKRQEQTYFDLNSLYLGEGEEEIVIISKYYRPGYGHLTDPWFDGVYYDHALAKVDEKGLNVYYNTYGIHPFNKTRLAFEIHHYEKDDPVDGEGKGSGLFLSSFIYEGEPYIYEFNVYKCGNLENKGIYCNYSMKKVLNHSTEDLEHSLGGWETSDFKNFVNSNKPFIDVRLSVDVEGGNLECINNSDCSEGESCSSRFFCIESS